MLLLDDCSTDTSRDILACRLCTRFASQDEFNVKNSGSMFKQRNKGVRLTKENTSGSPNLTTTPIDAFSSAW